MGGGRIVGSELGTPPSSHGQDPRYHRRPREVLEARPGARREPGAAAAAAVERQGYGPVHRSVRVVPGGQGWRRCVRDAAQGWGTYVCPDSCTYRIQPGI